LQFNYPTLEFIFSTEYNLFECVKGEIFLAALNPLEYEKAEVVIREITKGIYKIIKSKLPQFKEESYLENKFLVKLLNSNKVLILNDDSETIHQNFNLS
jgi:hypothetical protein